MPHVIMFRFEKYSHPTYEDSGCISIPPTTEYWINETVIVREKKSSAIILNNPKFQILSLHKSVVVVRDRKRTAG